MERKQEMRRRKEKRKKLKIQGYLMLCALCFILPIILLMGGSNLLALHLMTEKIAASVRNTVVLYGQYMDEKINTLDNYLINLGMNNIHFSEFGSAQDSSRALLYGTRLKNQVRNDQSLYEAILEGIFFFQRQEEYLIKYTNAVETVKQQEALEEKMRELADKLRESGRSIAAEWFSEKIGESYYVFRIYYYKDVCYGSWCNVDKILSNLVQIQIQDSENILLLDGEGAPLSSWEGLESISISWEEDEGEYKITDKNQEYMSVSVPIWNGEYYVTVLIRNRDIMQEISSFAQNMAVLTGICVILLLVFMNSTKHKISMPLRQLSFKMKQVEKGDLEASLPMQERILEFVQTNGSFNSMVREIKNLKIQVYEEIVQRQKTELEFLQLQIKPHFFINALNLVFNYARMEDLSAVKALTMNLVRHFRYTLYGKNFVSIREEIAFIHNYLEINERKNRGSCSTTFTARIPEKLEETQIPILVIQTFVENSIKFGEDGEGHTEVEVDVEKGEENKLHICVMDRGKGFEQEMLAYLNTGQGGINKPGTHVGIENVKKRLKILCGDQAQLRFYNRREGGAAVEIVIGEEIRKNELADRG